MNWKWDHNSAFGNGQGEKAKWTKNGDSWSTKQATSFKVTIPANFDEEIKEQEENKY